MVTYAVIDSRTGTMLSSHPSLDEARADVVETDESHDNVAIYVFDDTGHVSGECVGADC